MKILIVDNEPVALKMLEKILKKEIQEVEQIEKAENINEAKKIILNWQPDIVFLDIELNDGSGFDLLNQLETYNFQLIFVTAFEKYALNAFRFSAIDFIHKPFDSEAVIMAYNKAIQFIKNNELGRQIDVLKSALKKLNLNDQKIVLKDSKTIYFVLVGDIYHCKSEGNYTTFYFKDNKSIIVSKPIKEFESLLEPFGFIRTHHSHIVNKEKITKLNKQDGGHLVLDNGHEVPISQRKWETVIKLLEQN